MIVKQTGVEKSRRVVLDCSYTEAGIIRRALLHYIDSRMDDQELIPTFDQIEQMAYLIPEPLKVKRS